MTKPKVKILFFAEAVTLAHIIRPYSLAESLPGHDFEVVFASAQFPSILNSHKSNFCLRTLKTSISGQEFAQCLENGNLPFNEERLHQQVQEDIQLISEEKPDLVVGDFRLSLSLSTKVCQVPYINITNLCWSPYAIQKTVVPDIQLKRQLGPLLSPFIFEIAKQRAYKKLVQPFLKMASFYKIKLTAKSILDIYSDGDRLFLTDVENIVALKQLPSNYVIAGPVLYRPQGLEKTAIQTQSSKLPRICLQLGSSGPENLLEGIVQKLSKLPVQLIVSTAGKEWMQPIPSNVEIHKFIDISDVAKKVDLVICSGGSATAYPCLAEGTPVLTIPSNLDQFQFSQALVEKNVAIQLRPENVLKGTNLIDSVELLLKSNEMKENAMKFKSEISKYNISKTFQEMIQSFFKEKKANKSVTNKQNTEPEVLITGSHGFVGQHVLRQFPNAKILDRQKYDFSDYRNLKELIENVDVIIHLAAVNAGTSYNPSISELVHGNLFMTSQLLKAIQTYSKKRPKFIFLSSIHVYDKNQLIFHEDSNPNPNSSYGSMKYAQELLIQQAAEQKTIQAVIFRAGHIYGPGSKPFYNSAIATICHKAVHGESIDLYGQGLVQFDLTYVDDVVEYIRRAINCELSTSCAILNLASGFPFQLNEVVSEIEKILGKKLLRNLVNTPVTNNHISTEKLHSTLGNFERTSLSLGLLRQLLEMEKFWKDDRPMAVMQETISLTKAS